MIGNRALCAGFFSVAGQHCCSSMGLLSDYVVKFASPSCVRFISFGFLLATICVWVWMVCSLHSVTTGSRDRANVSLIIIIILYTYINRHAGTPHKTRTKYTMSLDCCSIYYIGSSIGWMSTKGIYKSWI